MSRDGDLVPTTLLLILKWVMTASCMSPCALQGYRTVSDKVWTIGQTSRDGDLIATLIDPDPSGSDSDSDDEAGGDGDGEVVPLIAVYELMMSAGFDEQLGESPEEWM